MKVYIEGIWINEHRDIWVHGRYVDEPTRDIQLYRAQITAPVLLENVDRIGTIIEVV